MPTTMEKQREEKKKKNKKTPYQKERQAMYMIEIRIHIAIKYAIVKLFVVYNNICLVYPNSIAQSSHTQ